MHAGSFSFAITPFCTESADEDIINVGPALALVVPRLNLAVLATRFGEKLQSLFRHQSSDNSVAMTDDANILSDPSQFIPPGTSIEFEKIPEGLPISGLSEKETSFNNKTTDSDEKVGHESSVEAHAAGATRD